MIVEFKAALAVAMFAVVEFTEVEFKPMIGVNFTIKALITKPRSIIIDPTT